MATAPLPRYITVAEFEQMEFDDEREYELIDGAIVEVSHPTYRHYKLTQRIAMLLRARFGIEIEGGREVPFVVEPGTKRSADVAALSGGRDREAAECGRLSGAPELVVEVVSPSNKTLHDRATAKLCLRNRAIQYWLVYPDDGSVDVFTSSANATYERGSSIPLPPELGGGEIAVDDIFPAD